MGGRELKAEMWLEGYERLGRRLSLCHGTSFTACVYYFKSIGLCSL